jgi:hypothetical protein
MNNGKPSWRNQLHAWLEKYGMIPPPAPSGEPAPVKPEPTISKTEIVWPEPAAGQLYPPPYLKDDPHWQDK